MLQRIGLILLAFTVFTAGCEPTPSPPLKTKRTSTVHHWGEPFDWEEISPQLDHIDFSELKFKTPFLRDTVCRWQSTIESTCGEGWYHEPWYRLRAGGKVVQWWSTVPELVGFDGFLEHNDQYRSAEIYKVGMGMSCASNTDTLEPEFAGQGATWLPITGWGANLGYVATDTAVHISQINFWLRGEGISVPERFDFFPGLARWEHRTTFDEVNYLFEVNLPIAFRESGSYSGKINPDVLRAWGVSEEAFRDAGLKMLDQLEEALAEEIESGAAIRRVSKTVTEGGTASDDPPRDFEEPVERDLLPEERQVVLDAARKEIGQRRDTFKKHSAEMYLALKKIWVVCGLGD